MKVFVWLAMTLVVMGGIATHAQTTPDIEDFQVVMPQFADALISAGADCFKEESKSRVCETDNIVTAIILMAAVLDDHGNIDRDLAAVANTCAKSHGPDFQSVKRCYVTKLDLDPLWYLFN